jgi:hypothetical protein
MEAVPEYAFESPRKKSLGNESIRYLAGFQIRIAQDVRSRTK